MLTRAGGMHPNILHAHRPPAIVGYALPEKPRTEETLAAAVVMLDESARGVVCPREDSGGFGHYTKSYKFPITHSV